MPFADRGDDRVCHGSWVIGGLRVPGAEFGVRGAENREFLILPKVNGVGLGPEFLIFNSLPLLPSAFPLLPFTFYHGERK
jgi:hypothetical protein